MKHKSSFVPFISAILAPPCAGKSTVVARLRSEIVCDREGVILALDADDFVSVATVYRTLSSAVPRWCDLPQSCPVVMAKDAAMRTAASRLRGQMRAWKLHCVVFTSEPALALAITRTNNDVWARQKRGHADLITCIPLLHAYELLISTRRRNNPTRWSPALEDDAPRAILTRYEDQARLLGTTIAVSGLTDAFIAASARIQSAWEQRQSMVGTPSNIQRMARAMARGSDLEEKASQS